MLYEVTAEIEREGWTYTSRHTKFSAEAAEKMVDVHIHTALEPGKHVSDIEVKELDIDPEQLVYVVEPGKVVRHCPSYYAADTETLELEPGEYPLNPVTVDHRPVDWSNPYWLTARIPARRVSGTLYSGFGGVNFASHELPTGEPVTWHFQCYAYSLGELLESGKIRVKKGN